MNFSFNWLQWCSNKEFYKHKRLHVHALINLINNKKIVMLENDT